MAIELQIGSWIPQILDQRERDSEAFIDTKQTHVVTYGESLFAVTLENKYAAEEI